jgi:uncharacterized protein YbjT (DUF2867 family)
MGKILVTGASGYIGGLLVPKLLARGYKVNAMVRGYPSQYEERWPAAEVVVADALEPDTLRAPLEGVTAAYYLIHSLLLGPEGFAADIEAAANFRKVAEESGVKRIIYLGGLGDARSRLSEHLKSRIEVARELQRGKVPVTILRAAIIIGAGSASYEIIHHLVRKLPLIVVPKWARNRCQPISIRDVISYLVGVLETPETVGESFDIGGKDVLTYERMMKILAGLLQKRRVFVYCPISMIMPYAYLASLITPVPQPMTMSLMEGLRSEVVCLNNEIRDLVPFETESYRRAVVDAMTREEQDRIHTRWSDAYPPAHELALKLHELKEPPRYVGQYSLLTAKSASSLFDSLSRIGGKEGWFHNNWMWRLRGALDRVLLGVGTSRGRKSYSSLQVNDVVDFWRVENITGDRLLLLRAEMKLPGKAWLEFKIEEDVEKNRLSVTAYYDTHGFLGKLYWYSVLPLHYFVFNKLLRQIERRS